MTDKERADEGKLQWHNLRVDHNDLPKMDTFVYLWNGINDYPIVASRHIPYGKEEKDWVWDCKWGSGYTISQSVGANYLWIEIVLPWKEIKEIND